MTDSRVFIGKITAATKNAAGFFDYDFQELHYDAGTHTMQNGQLSSGTGLKAVSLGEIGKTLDAPSLAVNALVAMAYSAGVVYITGSEAALNALVDVRYSVDDDAFYKTPSNGTEEEWAKSTLYPPTETQQNA